jgi:hypothetical protein
MIKTLQPSWLMNHILSEKSQTAVAVPVLSLLDELPTSSYLQWNEKDKKHVIKATVNVLSMPFILRLFISHHKRNFININLI